MVVVKFDKLKKQAIAYDGDTNVGECDYEEVGDVWNIVHTSVRDSYQGQGIAKKLVECLVEQAKNRKKKIVADCWYAKKVLDKVEKE